MNLTQLAGLAFLFSVGILLQILGCALYGNWWPLLTAVMYVLVPMPWLFFSNAGSSDFIRMDGGSGDGWENAAYFLTGFSAVGSFAIPAILHHAGLIALGAMLFEFAAFIVLAMSILLFLRANNESDW
eukprot:TRINITY_DN4080_c0_g1_i2.p1 TRINITY_DN4080_c0_g1~~TRINITY_DN4080_c0_g1_i2.p1  ORF type:complete len:128 (+),score=19.08 TRINITY_DN4080_c0_g1_i2:410-793(+)